MFETLGRSKRSPWVLAQIPAFFLVLFNLYNGLPGALIIHLFRSDWVRVVLVYFCSGSRLSLASVASLSLPAVSPAGSDS